MSLLNGLVKPIIIKLPPKYKKIYHLIYRNELIKLF